MAAEEDESDIPRLFDEGKDIALRSLVSFLNASGTPPPEFPASGSGTLARIGKHRGIVTAAHVVERLQKLKRVGLVRYIRPDMQGMELQMSHIRSVIIGHPPWTSNGPDLAFLILPDNQVATLEAKGCVFLDLETRRERIITQRDSKSGFYFCMGGLNDQIHSRDSTPERTNITGGGWVEPVNILEIRRTPLLDYAECCPFHPDPAYQPPASYAGMSGGGLFAAHVTSEKDGKRSCRAITFIGINFYESEPLNGRRKITCHYMNSVYAVLVEEVKKIV